MHTHKVEVVFLILFAAQMVVRADTVFLTDGTQREGTVTEDDGASVKLRVKRGPLTATVEIPRKEIERIEFKAMAVSSDEIEFQLLGKEAERLALLDPKLGFEAWLRYARFCEEKTGYSGYAKAAYEKVIALNPNQADARKALGYTFGDEGWTKPKVEEAITVGPRYIPAQQPTYTTASAPQNTNVTATYEECVPPLVSSTYSRNTYYVNDGGYNPVLYLGSVNGRLAPVSPSRFFYGSNSSSTQFGRTGYYSDGYYRSSSFGVMTQFSGNFGSTRITGSINGGCNTGSSYRSGPGFIFRR